MKKLPDSVKPYVKQIMQDLKTGLEESGWSHDEARDYVEKILKECQTKHRPVWRQSGSGTWYALTEDLDFVVTEDTDGQWYYRANKSFADDEALTEGKSDSPQKCRNALDEWYLAYQNNK